MKILIITNLFPNASEPNRAMFNKQQFLALREYCDFKVIAPLPHFKCTRGQVPLRETIDGMDVHHPRYLVIPKILRSMHGVSYYYGIHNEVEDIAKTFSFDLIFATWTYPDAYAASMIAKEMNKPLVIKVHGSDINLLNLYPSRRVMVQKTFKQAKKIIAVSQPLKRKLVELGVPEYKVTHLTNGIDTKKFHPMDKIQCRRELSLPLNKHIVLYVGNLELVKGVDILVDAVRGFPEDVLLIVVGDGNLKNILSQKIKDPSFNGRVRLVGSQAHDQIPLWLNAANCFCLPSRNEGCPNVILEALACGVPIVATNVGGIPDLIDSNADAALIEPENPKALAQGIIKILQRPRQTPSVQPLSWRENARQLFKVFEESV